MIEINNVQPKANVTLEFIVGGGVALCWQCIEYYTDIPVNPSIASASTVLVTSMTTYMKYYFKKLR